MTSLDGPLASTLFFAITWILHSVQEISPFSRNLILKVVLAAGDL